MHSHIHDSPITSTTPKFERKKRFNQEATIKSIKKNLMDIGTAKNGKSITDRQESAYDYLNLHLKDLNSLTVLQKLKTEIENLVEADNRGENLRYLKDANGDTSHYQSIIQLIFNRIKEVNIISLQKNILLQLQQSNHTIQLALQLIFDALLLTFSQTTAKHIHIHLENTIYHSSLNRNIDQLEDELQEQFFYSTEEYNEIISILNQLLLKESLIAQIGVVVEIKGKRFDSNQAINLYFVTIDMNATLDDLGKKIICEAGDVELHKQDWHFLFAFSEKSIPINFQSHDKMSIREYLKENGSNYNAMYITNKVTSPALLSPSHSSFQWSKCSLDFIEYLNEVTEQLRHDIYKEFSSEQHKSSDQYMTKCPDAHDLWKLGHLSLEDIECHLISFKKMGRVFKTVIDSLNSYPYSQHFYTTGFHYIQIQVNNALRSQMSLAFVNMLRKSINILVLVPQNEEKIVSLHYLTEKKSGWDKKNYHQQLIEYLDQWSNEFAKKKLIVESELDSEKKTAECSILQDDIRAYVIALDIDQVGERIIENLIQIGIDKDDGDIRGRKNRAIEQFKKYIGELESLDEVSLEKIKKIIENLSQPPIKNDAKPESHVLDRSLRYLRIKSIETNSSGEKVVIYYKKDEGMTYPSIIRILDQTISNAQFRKIEQVIADLETDEQVKRILQLLLHHGMNFNIQYMQQTRSDIEKLQTMIYNLSLIQLDHLKKQIEFFNKEPYRVHFNYLYNNMFHDLRLVLPTVIANVSAYEKIMEWIENAIQKQQTSEHHEVKSTDKKIDSDAEMISFNIRVKVNLSRIDDAEYFYIKISANKTIGEFKIELQNQIGYINFHELMSFDCHFRLEHSQVDFQASTSFSVLKDNCLIGDWIAQLSPSGKKSENVKNNFLKIFISPNKAESSSEDCFPSEDQGNSKTNWENLSAHSKKYFCKWVINWHGLTERVAPQYWKILSEENRKIFLLRFKTYHHVREYLIDKLVAIGEENLITFLKQQSALDLINHQMSNLKKLPSLVIQLIEDELMLLISEDRVLHYMNDRKEAIVLKLQKLKSEIESKDKRNHDSDKVIKHKTENSIVTHHYFSQLKLHNNVRSIIELLINIGQQSQQFNSRSEAGSYVGTHFNHIQDLILLLSEEQLRSLQMLMTEDYLSDQLGKVQLDQLLYYLNQEMYVDDKNNVHRSFRQQLLLWIDHPFQHKRLEIYIANLNIDLQLKMLIKQFIEIGINDQFNDYPKKLEQVLQYLSTQKQIIDSLTSVQKHSLITFLKSSKMSNDEFSSSLHYLLPVSSQFKRLMQLTEFDLEDELIDEFAVIEGNEEMKIYSMQSMNVRIKLAMPQVDGTQTIYLNCFQNDTLQNIKIELAGKYGTLPLDAEWLLNGKSVASEQKTLNSLCPSINNKLLTLQLNTVSYHLPSPASPSTDGLFAQQNIEWDALSEDFKTYFSEKFQEQNSEEDNYEYFWKTADQKLFLDEFRKYNVIREKIISELVSIDQDPHKKMKDRKAEALAVMTNAENRKQLETLDLILVKMFKKQIEEFANYKVDGILKYLCAKVNKSTGEETGKYTSTHSATLNGIRKELTQVMTTIKERQQLKFI